MESSVTEQEAEVVVCTANPKWRNGASLALVIRKSFGYCADRKGKLWFQDRLDKYMEENLEPNGKWAVSSAEIISVEEAPKNKIPNCKHVIQVISPNFTGLPSSANCKKNKWGPQGKKSDDYSEAKKKKMGKELVEAEDLKEKYKELERAYQNCLAKASSHASVSIPAISSKMMGCKLDPGFDTALKVIDQFLKKPPRGNKLRDIRLCAYGKHATDSSLDEFPAAKRAFARLCAASED